MIVSSCVDISQPLTLVETVSHRSDTILFDAIQFFFLFSLYHNLWIYVNIQRIVFFIFLSEIFQREPEIDLMEVFAF
jgi:hypothetical protein